MPPYYVQLAELHFLEFVRANVITEIKIILAPVTHCGGLWPDLGLQDQGSRSFITYVAESRESSGENKFDLIFTNYFPLRVQNIFAFKIFSSAAAEREGR